MKLLPPEVYIAPDYEALCLKAAELYLEAAGESIIERGRCSVALAGGTTPQRFYELLMENAGSGAALEGVHFFWADERCVPP